MSSNPGTPEGRSFAKDLSDYDADLLAIARRVQISGVRQCKCGLPECDQQVPSVVFVIDDTVLMATSPGAVHTLINGLEQAAAWVWPEGELE